MSLPLLKQELVHNQYPFTEAEFEKLRGLIFQRSGISISTAKKQLIYRRISNRLKALKLSSFSEYISILESGDSSENETFLNSITTNLTSFFRENHHFDYLANTAMPEILEAKKATRRLRIWSAGCSTGEEPYSIAMTLQPFSAQLDSWDAKVLCTDLDTEVLSKARMGTYEESKTNGLSQLQKERWFKEENIGEEKFLSAKPLLKKNLHFRQLNLMNRWPMSGAFDVVFCRNVMIYFDRETQVELVSRFAEVIEPNGHLIIGHSETLGRVSDRFELIGKTVYRKKY